MTAADLCPTCGSPVRIVSFDEGTSHYEPAAANPTPEPAPHDDEAKAEGLLRVLRENGRYEDGWTRSAHAIVGFMSGVRSALAAPGDEALRTALDRCFAERDDCIHGKWEAVSGDHFGEHLSAALASVAAFGRLAGFPCLSPDYLGDDCDLWADKYGQEPCANCLRRRAEGTALGGCLQRPDGTWRRCAAHAALSPAAAPDTEDAR